MKLFCTALAACITLPYIPACKKSATDNDGMKTLKINEVTHSVFYAPLYLADSLGYVKNRSRVGNLNPDNRNQPK